jgi:hypothetical protein
MKRCFINVAVNEPYVSYQKRLIKSVSEIMPDVPLLTWTDELPKGSKPHSESMYGFKMYAFQEAFDAGYDSVIWLDTPTVLHKNIYHVFELLEKNEYKEFAIATEAELYQYAHDSTLDYFGFTRQQIKDFGYKLNYGFIFGFVRGSKTYEQMFECERKGLFLSAEQDYQDHLYNSGQAFKGEYVEHRHEESIISMLIQTQGRNLLLLETVINHLEWEKTAL